MTCGREGGGGEAGRAGWGGQLEGERTGEGYNTTGNQYSTGNRFCVHRIQKILPPDCYFFRRGWFYIGAVKGYYDLCVPYNSVRS